MIEQVQPWGTGREGWGSSPTASYMQSTSVGSPLCALSCVGCSHPTSNPREALDTVPQANRHQSKTYQDKRHAQRAQWGGGTGITVPAWDTEALTERKALAKALQRRISAHQAKKRAGNGEEEACRIGETA